MSAQRSWFAPGDVGAFFALALDNISNLVLLSGILIGGFGFPADVLLTKMIPGTAFGVLVGDLAYTWMAVRLARKTGRADVTAMPLGLDTPSTVGVAVAVLGPTWLASKDAMVTWQVGMAVMILMGVIKVVAAFFGDAVRRAVPQAGLLGSIGGVGLALLGVLPLLHLFDAPIAGLVGLGVVIYALIARAPLPGRIPGALAAVVIATLLYYVLGYAGAMEGFHAPTFTFDVALPLPTAGFVDGMGKAIDFLPLAIPFALLTVVGGVNVTESARVAGDDYRTRDVLLVEAIATLAAGVTGGVAQSTPYIGHPAYKLMGARAGYTLLAGLFVGIGGALGVVQFLAQAIPATAIAPLLLFVGVEIVSQAFIAPPKAHAPAVALAFLPSVAELGRILIVMTTAGALAGQAAHTAHTVDVIAHGFIFTAMLWGALAADVIDRKLRRAAVWCAIAALASAFGLIHSTLPSGALYLPWDAGSNESVKIAIAYAGCALLFAALSVRAPARSGTELIAELEDLERRDPIPPEGIASVAQSLGLSKAVVASAIKPRARSVPRRSA